MKLLREIAIPKMRDRGENVNNVIKKHYDKKYENNINENENKSITEYQNESREINSYHWDKHKNPSETFPLKGKDHGENMENHTKNIDSVINKAKTPNKLTLYSGTIHDPREIKNNEGIVHHPAYLSTSVNENYARLRAHSLSRRNETSESHLLKIHVPKDHPGMYFPSATPDDIHTNETEMEFTLPRKTNLKHIKTTQETSSFGKKINVHHMKVVP